MPSKQLLFLSVLRPQCPDLIQASLSAYLTATIALLKVPWPPESTPHALPHNLTSLAKWSFKEAHAGTWPSQLNGCWFEFGFCQPPESYLGIQHTSVLLCPCQPSRPHRQVAACPLPLSNATPFPLQACCSLCQKSPPPPPPPPMLGKPHPLAEASALGWLPGQRVCPPPPGTHNPQKGDLGALERSGALT